jgi:hypothetical protein
MVMNSLVRRWTGFDPIEVNEGFVMDKVHWNRFSAGTAVSLVGFLSTNQCTFIDDPTILIISILAASLNNSLN